MAIKSSIPKGSSSPDVVNRLISQISSEIESGSLDKAGDLVERAKNNSAFPKHLAAIFSSRVKVKEGDLESSVIELANALEEYPDSIDLVVELGQLHSRFGSGSEAFKLLSKAIESEPNNHKVMGAFAGACQRNKQLHEAIKYYRKSLFSLSKEKKLKQNSPSATKAGFNNPETEALLWNTLTYLASSGVHAFPSHGTLLGIVREGGLLDHDKDLDVGVPFSEFDKATKVLQKNGWIRHRNNFGLVNPVSFVHKEKKISLDLCGFVVEKETGKTLYGFWMNNIPKGWNRILEVAEIDLERKENDGSSYWFPKKPENLLESLYGDWQKPDPEYDALIGSNGLRDFSLLTECYAYTSIISAIGKGQYGKAKKKFKIILKHKPEDELALVWLKKLEKVA